MTRDDRGRVHGPARRRPAAVYRRRRLAVLAGLLVALALVTTALRAAVLDPGPEPVSRSTGAAPSAGAVTPARTASPDPTAAADGPAPVARTQRASGLTASPVPVPHSAGGTLRRVALSLPANVDEGRTVRYAVEVEEGLPFAGEQFARSVHAILGDRRGWQDVEDVAFVLVPDREEADITVTLASPERTDELCLPLDTRGWLSCWNGERAVLNALRWATGSPTYGDDLAGYRRYLVAHEVGHGLDRPHVGCPRRGAPAPVMVQQTKSLRGCSANPYPAVGL